MISCLVLLEVGTARYPNSGTIYQKAQDFEEKTINAVTPRAKEIYITKIREVLK